MLKMELYRIFSRKKIYLFLLVGMICEIFLSLQVKTVMFEGFNSTVYRYYINQLKGNYTAEKHSKVENEYERLTNLIANEEEYERQYFAGELSAEEYRNISNDVKSAKSRIVTVEYILRKTEYYSVCEGKPEYFYDIGISDYVRNMSVDVVLIVILILVVVPIFTEDYYSGTVAMIRSSANGRRKLYLCRLKMTMLLSATLGILFYLTEFLTKYIRFDLGNMGADIRSLDCMQFSQLDVTVGEYILFTILIRTLYTVMSGVVIMLIANRIHSNIGAYAAGIGMIMIPYYLYPYMPKWMQEISLCKGLGAYSMFNAYDEIIGIPIVVFCGMTHCVLLSILIIWQCNKYGYM